MKKLVLFCMLVNVLGYSQITEIKKFPYTAAFANNKGAHLLFKDNTYYMFYYDSMEVNDTAGYRIMMAKSTDGVNWGMPLQMTNFNRLPFHSPRWSQIAGCIFKNKFVVAYHYSDTKVHLIISDDGINWTESVMQSFITGQFSLTTSADTCYFVASYNGKIRISQTADLNSWGVFKPTFNPVNFSTAALDNDKLALFYESLYQDGAIYMRYFQYGSLSDSIPVIPASEKGYFPQAVKTTDGTLWMAYNKKSLIAGDSVSDIYYIKSDNLKDWSQPAKFTSYSGDDKILSFSGSSLPLVTFESTRANFLSRNDSTGICYGVLGQSIDGYSSYPVLFKIYSEIVPNVKDESLMISAKIKGGLPGDKFYLKYFINNGLTQSVQLLDDGGHNDSLINDEIFGNKISVLYNEKVTYWFMGQRNNITGGTDSITILIPFLYAKDSYKFEVNKLIMPMNNVGTLADVRINNKIGGEYDEAKFLFSGGFLLSGHKNDSLWINGQASASLVENYLPGKLGSNPNDPTNIIYVVKREDPPFSLSWQQWQYAVQMGADFYDGNNDGLYTPIDLNENYKWDPNEDRPLLNGDITAWCVFNDGVIDRVRYDRQKPQGIEVQQSIFGSGNDDGKTNNILFIRYKIINKNPQHQDMDSVYFTFWADPDLGYWMDDLVGCDTLSNSAFVYNDDYDNDYGHNSPAFFIQCLQGPVVYIPGVTFTDNNGNGVYDERTDIPLDTAYIKTGAEWKVKIIPGAVNQNISSFINLQPSDPIWPGNNDGIDVRFHQEGRNSIGNLVDPCSFTLGEVRGGVDCSMVNPSFWYSGDPVTNKGWINNRATDQRVMLNLGPFKLPYLKDVEIIGAYIVGRGSDNLNSISTAREIAQYSQQVYNSNFALLPHIPEKEITKVNEYSLYQNYPNPFNPATTIRYSLGGALGTSHHVIIKLYDILGREAAVLLDENKYAGEHEVTFNSARYNLSSGVYFYRLTSDGQSFVKKMILLK